MAYTIEPADQFLAVELATHIESVAYTIEPTDQFLAVDHAAPIESVAYAIEPADQFLAVELATYIVKSTQFIAVERPAARQFVLRRIG